MEQPLFSPPVVSIILVLFVTLIILYTKKSKPHNKKNKLPPGPWRLPIIGNLHQIISSSPHHKLANMAKTYGPMMHLQLGQVPHLIVSSPEAATEVMKNHDLEFADRPSSFAVSIITYNCKDVAFAPYGNYWRWLRKICIIDLLSTKRVQYYRCIREEEVSSMIESIHLASSEGSTMDINDMLLALTSGITARASFGKSSTERNAVFASLVQKLVKAAGGFFVVDFFPSIGFLPVVTGLKSNILKLHREADDMLQSIIDEHRSTKATMVRDGEPENLLDFLLNLQEHRGGQLEFPFTMEHIKAIIWDMFSAGIETSSTTLEWVMSELMANPTTMQKVQTEVRHAFKDEDKVDETKLHTLKYFDAVIKEALRLHPPFPFLLPRKVRENVHVNGYEIPIDTTVLINAWAIGRDPNYWKEPEKFSPKRFFDSDVNYKGTHFQLIPFGAGRRMCIGMLFGMAGVELALANLLYHFDWELPNGMEAEGLDMSEAFGLTTTRKVHLHLKPISMELLPQNPNGEKCLKPCSLLLCRSARISE